MLGQQHQLSQFDTQIQDDKILNVEEYWAEPYPAPEWRKQWVEIY